MKGDLYKKGKCHVIQAYISYEAVLILKLNGKLFEQTTNSVCACHFFQSAF